MLNLNTLDDINAYYLNKGIRPYWNVYPETHGLQLNHIITITNKFHELHSIYPSLILNGIGDYLSYELHCYNNCNSFSNRDEWIKKPTFTHDIFGIEVDYFSNASYRPSQNVILINHNSFLLEFDSEGNLKIAKSLIHEFAHALDEQYAIYKKIKIQDMFNEYKNNSIFSENANNNIREFIAEVFEKSFYLELEEIRKIKTVIDEIINNF